MTKEEFLEHVRDAIDNVNSPGGEYAAFIVEGEQNARNMAQHDPVLGQKVTRVVEAMKDLGTYLKHRGESQ